ncbi:AcrR family transcriptional regulator [Bradyrhizobium sp. GM2.2]|uniref:TetR/AcrR family transcriptional regulator n=1 Tax=Bradyrhizobium sp. GM2.2 TaxID=3156358 RepID=UPI0033931D6B
MAEAKSSTPRRDRGRPQLRPDDETRQIIYEAARHEFAANGYAATSTETVARGAGVSTKTLYRLVPNKAALFEGMVSDRLDRFLADFNLQVPEDADIEAGLNAALMAYADLGLDPDVIGLQRIILQETAQFPDLAAAFYNNGIVRTTAALSNWLRLQINRRLIDLDNPEEAAGILIGMVASAPQRAALYGGVPLPSRAQLKARVRKCVTLFLNGCGANARAG